MRIAKLLVLAGVLAIAPGYAQADRWHGDIHSFHVHDYNVWRSGYWYRGPHGSRLGWWWVVGPMWYYYPAPVYPYPDPYQPPVVIQQAPQVLIQQEPPVESAPPAPPPAEYWYYCKNPKGYYPYVAECSQPWQKVPAQPPRPPSQ